jgi:MFS family permease
MVAGYIVLSQTSSIFVLGIALTLGSIGSAVVRPALTTLLTGSVGDEDRGLVLGAQQSLASIATAAGPAVSGLLIQRGLHGVWALGMATMALGLLVVRWLLGSRNV